MLSRIRSLMGIVTTGALFVGCGPPSADYLAAKYSSAPDAFTSLLLYAQDDLGERACLVVGTDTIQNGVTVDNWNLYWKHEDQWERVGNREVAFTLTEVLSSVGLTHARYDEYMRLLAKAGGERITYCDNARDGVRAEVLVYRSGLGVSGCGADMVWTPGPISRIDLSGSEYSRVVDAGGGWRLALECS
jgi:hypothetical protein